jgi:DNA ligase 1
MIDKTLYKLSKTDNVLIFRVYTEELGEGHVIVTEKGYYGGAMQQDIKVCEPKNIGRANETTTEDQAISEATSKLNKLKDKGYKDIPDSEEMAHVDIHRYLVNLEGTDAYGNLLPMLAQKDIKKITFPGFLQRKYDGMRAIIKLEKDGTLTIRSRNGKPLETLSHILEDVNTDHMVAGDQLDGELYCHGRSLQSIVSLTKRMQPDTQKIQFRCYDMLDTRMSYESRKILVKAITLKSGPAIVYVNTVKVNSMEDVMKYFNIWKAKGFEGAMWRDPEGYYEPGRRSYSLIKVKDFEEEEFEIIGVEEATGRDAGTAIFRCITSEGVEFSVRPMGSRELRRDYFENFEEYEGKLLTVRFQNWTPDGKPFHARGITIRDYD